MEMNRQRVDWEGDHILVITPKKIWTEIVVIGSLIRYWFKVLVGAFIYNSVLFALFAILLRGHLSVEEIETTMVFGAVIAVILLFV